MYLIYLDLEVEHRFMCGRFTIFSHYNVEVWAFSTRAKPITSPRDTRVTTTPKVSSCTKKVISVILVSKACTPVIFRDQYDQ